MDPLDFPYLFGNRKNTFGCKCVIPPTASLILVVDDILLVEEVVVFVEDPLKVTMK